jgi:hypothetical protein
MPVVCVFPFPLGGREEVRKEKRKGKTEEGRGKLGRSEVKVGKESGYNKQSKVRVCLPSLAPATSIWLYVKLLIPHPYRLRFT